MAYSFEAGKDAIIESVVEKIHAQQGSKLSPVFATFVRQFYGTTSLDDLQSISPNDLYGAAANLMSLIQYRRPEETKIRIYNPDYERHGWQTSHTVVEVVCDDMPFLVDTIRTLINRMGIASHLIIFIGNLTLHRNAEHEVTEILPHQAHHSVDTYVEAAIFIEIARQTDPFVLEELHCNLERVLLDNQVVCEDWSLMREKVCELVRELDCPPKTLDEAEVKETQAFLHWIENHHFTFLGICDYEMIRDGQEISLQVVPDSGCGILTVTENEGPHRLADMMPGARELMLSNRILVASKTNTESTVHRDTYTDYIGVKRFNAKGEVIGERRIIGLYTSAAYNTSPRYIPFLRHKVAKIMADSGLAEEGHAGKVLLNILETMPRDDLIHGSEEELLEMAIGIFHLQERRRIRLFARTDVYHRFVSCLVYVPKDIFNSKLRETMEVELKTRFRAFSSSFSTRFTDSVLARVHFMLRIDPNDKTVFDFKAAEKALIEIGRTWIDDFQNVLYEMVGEEVSNRLFVKYKHAFQTVYQENFSPRTAVFDVQHIEEIADETALGMNFYRPLDDFKSQFRLKIYRRNEPMPLSDVLPIIEKLGLRAISERPYVFQFDDHSQMWINDFSLHYIKDSTFKIDDIRERFQNAFSEIWFGQAENDGFNQLVLAAGLDWRQIAMLRAYAKYFKQIGLTFSQEYIEAALVNHPKIAQKMVQLFELRFNPELCEQYAESSELLKTDILTNLDGVDNLDEDKIIRYYLTAIEATNRTNFYQLDDTGKAKSYISLKLNSRALPNLPKPYPLFEIFVYSPRFEGVHLRGGKVARGGLRWSDRREDFRTEVLGLMKAQQVKNAVIVPSGAKGGFVPKQLPLDAGREAIQQEGVFCYQQFIRGLLDLTDNYCDGVLVKPEAVVCYDEDDPYLVVAADKGTATFSDLANAISHEYHFWLGDAFASGGSVGYDHKKMGITARGAFESVTRHFYEMGIDIQATDFTVVGIGDMAGDVFGNGMLLSKHIALVAAFNHQHIFIDPNPNTARSFEERQRLFNLPRSSWSDYDRALISSGGGVFNRTAKSITVTPEMKKRFEISEDHIEPNDLIRCILKAPYDLLWSGGIGTFVKAQGESNADVGDRSNDPIRINGVDLRCKVVGEGGNLGLTQLGRVEFALQGGHIYTDFIDNSAGVSCSDREVNIKILLDRMIIAGDLTEKQRNHLLVEMTDDVAHLVLRENYLQPRAISQALSQSFQSLELHSRYISELERSGKMDRALECLPSEKMLQERKSAGIGLVSPDICTLLCYSKILLKESILDSNVPEDEFLNYLLIQSFPTILQKRYHHAMQSHPLRREIIATRLSNLLVDEMGFSFVYRLQHETGASEPEIVRAYMIARSALNMEVIWHDLEALDHLLTVDEQHRILMIYVRLLRRTARWFLKCHHVSDHMTRVVKKYAPGVKRIKATFPHILGKEELKQYQSELKISLDKGIPETFAHELAITSELFAVMDVIEAAQTLKLEIEQVADIYFSVGEVLQLNWIRKQIIAHPTENYWEALSREALRDDLDYQQRALTAAIVQQDMKHENVKMCLEKWSTKHTVAIARWNQILTSLKASSNLTYTMFFVVMRELLDLTHAS